MDFIEGLVSGKEMLKRSVVGVAGEGKLSDTEQNDNQASTSLNPPNGPFLPFAYLQALMKAPMQFISEPSVFKGASGIRFIGTRVGQDAFTAVTGDIVTSDRSLEDGKVHKDDSDAAVKQKLTDAVNMIMDCLQTPAMVPMQFISELSVFKGASGIRFIGACVGQGAFFAVAGNMVIGSSLDKGGICGR
ncbi:hypothetical protein GYMLUDRAFT_244006 [Collybiopsis luxurians FD-317 M1]|uniref:Uncharacterized protein n=1 Tax=Collybiopsis luxurians FD-317 M1 TaxID=944289 RepID=A0A0D0CPN9_9AGAR|nr:hypothetical protein GYMLUDRAFT_244006 [Collybiopsis luxurians FD-317 M1]